MLEAYLAWRRGSFELDVRFQVHEMVMGVLGASGAGKTTLLHALAGIVRPDAGRIVLDDRVLFDSERAVNMPAHRRGVAVVFQDGRLFPHYNVEGNLRYGERQASVSGQRLDFGAVVELLELGRHLNRPIRGLSGGERQRVAIGRALLSSPSLLLMDEPLASLDVGLKDRVLPFLTRVKESVQIPMLYVSHDVGEIVQLTDHLLILDGGRVVGHGPFLEVVDDPRIFPLARRLGLQNVVETTVKAHEEADGITRLALLTATATPETGAATPETGMATLAAPYTPRPVGARVLVSIRPEDIAIATDPVEGVSIQNQLPGRLLRVTQHHEVDLIEVDVGVPLLAEVTPRSVARLGLVPGRQVYCLFKVQGVRYVGT